MNTKTRKIMVLAIIMLTFCLFSLEQSISAQILNPQPLSNCLKVKGNSIEIWNGVNGTNAIYTNAGILNGTGEYIIDFNAGFLPTPDPNSFTLIGENTITTAQGQLKLRQISLNNVETTWLYSDIAHIKPDASTGRFAGATGALFFRGKSTDGGFTFNGEFNGEICFAKTNSALLPKN